MWDCEVSAEDMSTQSDLFHLRFAVDFPMYVAMKMRMMKKYSMKATLSTT